MDRSRIIQHQVNGTNGQFEIMSGLTVDRLVEMGILKYVWSSKVEIDQHDGSTTLVEVRSYHKA